jgi:hypothetical protein
MADARTQIWYATESDPFRALHEVFEVVRGDERQLFECGGWTGRSESCVTAALTAAGFVNGSARAVSVRQISPEDGVDVIRHFGFQVDDDAVDAADEALRAGLRGDLGGWTAALMGQVGFHRSVLAFSHVWAAAGKPPILLAHPPSDRATGKATGGPATLTSPHELDRRARLALSRFKELTR